MSTALVDRSMQKLSWLLSTDNAYLCPEHVLHADDHDAYAHLQQIGLLQLSAQAETQVICPSCQEQWIRPMLHSDRHLQGLCLECGNVPLGIQNIGHTQLNVEEVARRLQMALSLQTRFQLTATVPGHLWRLGDLEINRKRHTLVFAYGLTSVEHTVTQTLPLLAPSGVAVVFSFESLPEWMRTWAGAHIPLAAVLRLRKTAFVLDDWQSYVYATPSSAPTFAADDTPASRTSLHLLRSSHIALIEGERHSVPPDARQLLLMLLEAEGEEIHKSELAERLGKPHDFKLSVLFRRCKPVQETFVVADERGRYRIHDQYCLV
jgi:hypothetical protein